MDGSRLPNLIIYGARLKNSNEYRYVGKTVKGSYRFEQHRREALLGVKTTPFYNWLRKYLDDVVYDVLEVSETVDKLDSLEIHWIATLRLSNHRLLNIAPGGTGGKLTAEPWNKGKRGVVQLSGKNHWNFGKRHSDETKEKQRQASLGKGKSHQKVACPHCGQIGGIGSMKRYHFDNCKYSKISQCPVCLRKDADLNSRYHFENCGKRNVSQCPHCPKEGINYMMTRYHFDNCKNKVN